MICNICGTENDNSMKICRICGNNLRIDEPFIPRLDAERISLPQAGSTSIPPPQGYPHTNMNSNPQQSMNNPYMNTPPMYSQPVGYDQNGMPIFAPMYNQYAPPPQIIGYDQNGMPIFAPVYNQYAPPPQIIGYDQNGMPVYAPVYNQYTQPQNMSYPPPPPPPPPAMQSMPDMPIIAPEPKEKKEEKVDIPDDFWAFFDGEKSSNSREEPSSDDFFGKSAHNDAMGDVSTAGLNTNALRRSEKKKNSYMSDTPIVDASKLKKNDASKYNEMYMKKAEAVNSNDLIGNGTRRQTSERDKMGTTKQVDAGRMTVKLKVKPKISMTSTGYADPDAIETYIPEHKEAIMGSADRAVEAMPKRSNPYQNELDIIELPEYMQAKKTQYEETAEIPSIPELKLK